MGHKLSILPRASDKTGWHQSSQFKVEEIQSIKVDGAGMSKSLNSIPSPFARMHLFETAFQMVYQDLINNTKLAGETYNKMVSDCLDVFEMIYYWDAHIADGKPLQFVTWIREKEIHELLESSNKSHKLLGKTLQTYLDSDQAFGGFSSCLMIKYNNQVIAGSTPFTGFFTTPDTLEGFRLLKPLSQQAYFFKSIPFSDRKGEIRKFIYDFFEEDHSMKTVAASSIRSFLEWHKNQIPDTALTLHPIVMNGSQVYCFGRPLLTARGIGTQLFEPQLIRVNYRMNEDCFYMPRHNNQTRQYDYLLPLSDAFFEQFAPKLIPDIVSITEREPGTVEVSIAIPKGKVVTKVYQQKQIHDQDGKIIDLYEDHQIKFDLGIFPFIKVAGQPENTAGYNDCYRVMVMLQDNYFKYSNKDFQLQFGKDGHLFEGGGQYKVSYNERTILSQRTHVGSSFYGLNTAFDFIRVSFPPLVEGRPVRGTIAVNWKEKPIGNKQIDFAVDFGTTSTFIAYTDDPTHGSEPKPFELDEKDLAVAMLNKSKEKRPEFLWTDCFEKALPDFLEAIEIQKQEFVPSIIKRKEKYGFPIRTVLFQQSNLSAAQKELLINANISFVYQKPDVASLAFENQQYKPNLKWKIKVGDDFESAIQIFIEELFLLIRTKILLSDGDPAKSKIYWFYPLSFSPAVKKAYMAIWRKYASKYLQPTGENIISLTESEAPFYYLFKKSAIQNSRTVVTMDIGGGSTDIMVFDDNKPAFGSSVNFGANVIWGQGFNEFGSDKDNGIYQKIRQEISGRLNPTELKRLNEEYTSVESSSFGSDEIINFWIANEDKTKVLERLNSGDFRLVYLLHLSALIYHTLYLLKTGKQGAPTSIIFSGNGSKYVDLISDNATIAKIWGYFARKIFGAEARDPQVVLPANNRKEATSFGGLFVPQASSEPGTKNYLGFENTGSVADPGKDITYGFVEKNREAVFTGVLQSFREFADWFFEMNQTRELNFRMAFGIETKPSVIKKYLLDKAPENLDQGYKKRKDTVDPDDRVTDSLFYYPFVGLIYLINKLEPADLKALAVKEVFYATSPDGDPAFSMGRLNKEQKPDSIFTITVEEDEPDIAAVNIIDSPAVHQRALQSLEGYISPVCSYGVHPDPGQSIRVLHPGKARKQDDRWVVEDKIAIEFY